MQKGFTHRRASMAARTILAACGWVLLGTAAQAASIFSDDFSSSTIPTGTYPTPTATSTGYAIAGAKPQVPNPPTIGTGALAFGLGSTTGAIEEAQAQFTTTPVQLTNVGDSIGMTVVFTNTAGILASTSTLTGQLDFGMYNSSASAPKTDLQASGLSSSLTADATGGAAGWQGYVSQLFQTGGSNPRVVTRPAQTGADNTNQDLVTDNASGSQSYHSPTGTSLGNSGTDQTLTAGNQYAELFTITLTAAGTYQITSTLYSGNTASGTPLSTQTDNATGANFFSGGFDALSIGWRETASQASEMTVNSINIVSPAVTPEPGSLALLGLGALGMIRRRARI